MRAPGRQPGLLALLALAGSRCVHADRIAAELWPSGVPTRSAVHVLVCRTAGCSAQRVLRSRRSATATRLVPDALTTDLTEFHALVRAAAQTDDPYEAAIHLDLAELLWRGQALDGLRSFPFAQDQAVLAEEERLDAHEDRVDLHLRCDDRAPALRGARELVAVRPFCERPWRQLMSALARSGRRRESLLAFQDLCRRLAEVGLNPERETVELERAIAALGQEISA